MSKNNTYFIWGPDSFLVDREIADITARLKEQYGDDPEIISLDADEISPRQLLETLQSSSLFSLQRIIVIKNPGWLGKSKRKVSKTGEMEKVLQEYWQSDKPGQILILTANEHSSGNSLVKLLDKEAAVISCKAVASQYLSGWIQEGFEARNRSIKPAALNLLVRSGQDMYYLQNLIEKLCLMAEGRIINEEDVEAELSSKEEIKVFKLTDALLKRNLPASFRAFYQLLNQGEHPIFFLYMTVRQFMTLGKVKYYLEKGISQQEIAKQTNLKEFTIKKMMESARSFSWEEIREIFRLLLNADIAFKSSGQDEKIIMETLIVELCSKK